MQPNAAAAAKRKRTQQQAGKQRCEGSSAQPEEELLAAEVPTMPLKHAPLCRPPPAHIRARSR